MGSEKTESLLETIEEETRSIIEDRELVAELNRFRDDVEELLSEEGLVYQDELLEELEESYLLPQNSDYRLEDYVSEFDFVIETSGAPRGPAYIYSE